MLKEIRVAVDGFYNHLLRYLLLGSILFLLCISKGPCLPFSYSLSLADTNLAHVLYPTWVSLVPHKRWIKHTRLVIRGIISVEGNR